MAQPQPEDRAVGSRGLENRIGATPNSPLARRSASQVPALLPRGNWPEPLTQPNYIDRVAESVSLDGDTYLVHWSSNGRRYSARIPDAWVARGGNRTTSMNSAAIRNTRQEALTGLVPHILAGGFQHYIGFWSNASTPVIVPTLFSNISTPRILAGIEAKDADMRRAAMEAADQLRGLASGMLAGKALGLGYQAVRNPNAGMYKMLDRGTGHSQPSSPQPQPLAPVASAGSRSATAPPAGGATSSTLPPVAGTSSGTGPPTRGTTTSSRAPLNELLPGYRTAPGEVLGTVSAPAAPVATTLIGRERESMLPSVLFQRFPESQLRTSFQKGPDVEWVGGVDPGFDIADLKPAAMPPRYANYHEFVRQVRTWGSEGWANREAPKTFRAAMISYDAYGNYYVETVIVVGPNYQVPLEQLARPPKRWK